jgi:hypothetical protein
VADVKSQAAQRADLVAALDGLAVTVDGVDHVLAAHPCRPPAPQAYECWPQWTATRPTAQCVDELDWLVLVVVPGPDAQTFVAAGDDLVDTVADALVPWQLTRIEPVRILVGENQDVPGLQFALTI